MKVDFCEQIVHSPPDYESCTVLHCYIFSWFVLDNIWLLLVYIISDQRVNNKWQGPFRIRIDVQGIEKITETKWG